MTEGPPVVPATPSASLVEVIAVLARRYSPPAIPTDPLHQILWENIGYLIDDQKRRALFDRFAATVGLSAAAIAAADDDLLFAITEQGGMRPETRVERWRTIAALVQERCAGDLNAALRALPPPKARALLKLFPTIGDPGADKVLLFADVAPQPCLDSNGLRVLARLGFFAEQPSYNANYKAAIGVLRAQGRGDRAWLVDAYILLRAHGKALCRRGHPECLPCPLDTVCGHAEVAAL